MTHAPWAGDPDWIGGYCAPMTQEEWSGRLAQTIGREIRRCRDRRGMSAQQVADACTELGLPLQRSVLANLESGRRATLTVAELIVLARVLRVSPLVLVFPVGHEDQFEVLDGQVVPPWPAAKWFSGEGPLYVGEPLFDWARSSEPGYYRKHDELELRYLTESGASRQRRKMAADAPGDDDRKRLLDWANENQDKADQAVADLRNHRRVMRDQRLVLPELRPELRYIDVEEEGEQHGGPDQEG